MLKRLLVLAAVIGTGLVGLTGEVWGAVGRSEPWQLSLQNAYSPVMEEVRDFHWLLLAVQLVIVVLVLGILGYCIFRFNARRNPVPSRTSHNTVLEVLWTAVPIVILVVIAIPGLRLLYYSDRAHEYDMTLKVTGHQWYWSYNYPDYGDFAFDSFIVPDEYLEEGQPRLLSVDNRVVVPVGTNIQILVTSDDVIHNWAIPSLGMKIDATPGRVNERWLRVEEEGTYYGMCSELCGVNHGFMPIEIRAVSQEEFQAWVGEAQEKYARRDDPPAVDLAVADPRPDPDPEAAAAVEAPGSVSRSTAGTPKAPD